MGVGSGVAGGLLGAALTLPPRPVDYWQKLFAAGKAACVAKHAPPSGWKVALNLELTFAEIVDVSSGSNSELGTCLSEVAWGILLARRLHPNTRSSETVVLGS